jgi:hypothetical protein
MKNPVLPPGLLLAVSLICAGCSTPQRGGTVRQPTGFASSEHAAGIEWGVPARWHAQPARPMRVATYSVPAAAGDPEAAECAAYFFGPGQGGSVDANLERWAAQFTQPDGQPSEARQETREVSGLKVHTTRVSGTYLAAAGPMSTVSQMKPNFAMLGAIVEAPQGLVFFKLTGPAKTVEAARGEFNALLDTVRREPEPQ